VISFGISDVEINFPSPSIFIKSS